MPGYGFSQAASKPGLSGVEMGRIFVILMKRLGHEHFYLQGGDWGALIGSVSKAISQFSHGAHNSNEFFLWEWFCVLHIFK